MKVKNTFAAAERRLDREDAPTNHAKDAGMQATAAIWAGGQQVVDEKSTVPDTVYRSTATALWAERKGRSGGLSLAVGRRAQTLPREEPRVPEMRGRGMDRLTCRCGTPPRRTQKDTPRANASKERGGQRQREKDRDCVSIRGWSVAAKKSWSGVGAELERRGGGKKPERWVRKKTGRKEHARSEGVLSSTRPRNGCNRCASIP